MQRGGVWCGHDRCDGSSACEDEPRVVGAEFRCVSQRQDGQNGRSWLSRPASEGLGGLGNRCRVVEQYSMTGAGCHIRNIVDASIP